MMVLTVVILLGLAGITTIYRIIQLDDVETTLDDDYTKDASDAVSRLFAGATRDAPSCVWSPGAASVELNVTELMQRSHLYFQSVRHTWLSYGEYHDALSARAAAADDWSVVHVAAPVENEVSEMAPYAAPLYFGQRLIGENLLAPPFGLWATKLYMNPQIVSVPRPNVSTPQFRERQPQLYFIAASSAFINAPDVVSCRGVVFCSCGCKPAATVSSRLLRDPRGPAPVHMSKVVVFLHNPYPTNLYHVLVEILPRLVTVDAILADAALDVVLAVPYLNDIPICKRIVEFITAVFGVPRERMLHLLHGQLSASVIVVPMPAPCLDQYPQLLLKFRQRVFAQLPTAQPAADASLVIVVALAIRPKEKKRRILNIEEVQRALSQSFFGSNVRVAVELVPVTIGLTHTFLEQAAMFHRFDVLFGVHGSNLAILMWMRRGAHVIEVMPRVDGNTCYYRLSSHVGIVHHLMFHNNSKDAAVAVDVKELARHVEVAVTDVAARRGGRR